MHAHALALAEVRLLEEVSYCVWQQFQARKAHLEQGEGEDGVMVAAQVRR